MLGCEAIDIVHSLPDIPFQNDCLNQKAAMVAAF
jgi:hypothetical protein